MNDTAAPRQETASAQVGPSKIWRLMAVLARWVWVLVIAGGLLLGATWALLHGWIVPRIEDFRPRLESLASRAVGTPVRVGRIVAQSSGLIPTFELQDVVVQDSAGRQVLLLPRVLVALSATSLWGGGFDQLVLDQPVLDVRRTADGKIYVGGLDMSQKGSDDRAAADWFFSQSEFAIQGGALRWTDDLAKAPTLELQQVNAVVRNTARRHSFRVDATPPKKWGEPFSVRGLFRQPLLSKGAGDFSDWSGQLYADFQQLGDLAQIKPYASSAFGVTPNAGSGSLRAWVDVGKGQVDGATLDVALQAVSVQLGQGLSPLALNSAAGRLAARRLANGFEWATEGLTFKTQDGLVWPGGNFAFTREAAAGQTEQKNTLKADRLDLAAVAQIASRLPLGTQTHALLASLNPKGLVQKLEAKWSLPTSGQVSANGAANPANTANTTTKATTANPPASSYSAKGLVSGLQIAALPSQLFNSAPSRTSEGRAPSVMPASPAQPGRPGLSGATVEFDLSQAGGKAAISIIQGHLDLPGVFEEPRVLFDQLSLDAEWSIANVKNAPTVDAYLRNIKFTAADAEGQAEARWRSGNSSGVPPTAAQGSIDALGNLDLKGVLSRANAARVHRYMPLVMAESTRQYVRDAVIEGDLTDVKFLVKGPVALIPYPDASKGEFQISAKAKNGVFAYVPPSIQLADTLPWPVLSGVSTDLVFNRASLTASNISATMAGLQLSSASARIPSLFSGATVNVQARLAGPVSDALALIKSSPLSGMTGNVLSGAAVTGAADYALSLNLPLKNIDQTTVAGTVTLPGNDAQLSSAVPLLSRLKGVATFSETGFTVLAAQAKFLGGDVRFEGGLRPQPAPLAGELAAPNPVFRAQGTATAEALRQAKDLGITSYLAQNASGSTAYSAVLGFRRGVAELLVTGNLQGMALALPAPLTKSVDALQPFRYQTTLARQSADVGQPLQELVSVSIPGLAAVEYLRDISGPQAKVIRGTVAIGLEPGESVTLPESGVAANVKLAAINIDAWEKVFSNSIGLATNVSPAQPTAAVPLPAASAAATPVPLPIPLPLPLYSVSPLSLPSPAAAPPGGVSSPSQLVQSYLPNKIALRANELVVGGRRLNNLVIGGTREGSLWRANLDATELNGYVEFRQPGSVNAGRVYARLSRLSLGPNNAADVENLLDAQPASIPALDIVVDDLELRGKKLGRVEVDAVNQSGQAGGGVREWRLRKFDVTLPEAVLKATGDWVAVNARSGASLRTTRGAEMRRTVLNFDLTLLDSGELLKRFGMTDVVRRGKGKMMGQVAWLGSPLALDTPSLSGQFNINIESGQFLKADPGLAKLLGVLSLQSLPRRLALDFRDVFSDGFAFDFVRGDVTINQGLAATNNFQMKGVNAAVLLEGSADIVKETQELKVLVVPEINAGTASLITAVINPVVGLGTFLAQLFLRQPLMKAATQEFYIDGSWADPKVTKGSRPESPKPASESPAQ